MPRRQLAQAVAVMMLSMTMVVPLASPSAAAPAGEAKALAQMKQEWAQLSMQQKLGTCNAFRRNPTVMVQSATTAMWSRPGARQGMTLAGWARVYRKYFAWACSGAGRSPRP